jgi:hypothetical protein
MKKTLLTIILFCTVIQIFSQTLEVEKQYFNSQIQSGQLSQEQIRTLSLKWNSFIGKFKYPALPINKVTGEIDFTDTLSFGSLDKKVIFERCLEWIAINYGNILHKDLEAGKIIANGNMNIKHTADYYGSFGKKEEFATTTSANYAIILTVKDNKLKYNITNIEYTFYDYSLTVSEITLPLNSLFPMVSKDDLQWKRYVTVLNESTKTFYFELKDSLMEYINKADEDYNF